MIQLLAYRKMDLLSALLHEQGHALGLEGIIDSANDVMGEALGVGVRRLPALGQAEGAVPGSLDTVQYLTSDSTGACTKRLTIAVPLRAQTMSLR